MSEKEGVWCSGGVVLLEVVCCGGSCDNDDGNDCIGADSDTVGWLVILVSSSCALNTHFWISKSAGSTDHTIRCLTQKMKALWIL